MDRDSFVIGMRNLLFNDCEIIKKLQFSSRHEFSSDFWQKRYLKPQRIRIKSTQILDIVS